MIKVINPYLTCKKTVAPGSTSLENVPLAIMVSFSPLGLSVSGGGKKKIDRSNVRDGWVGDKVNEIDSEDVVFGIGTELNLQPD